MFDHILGNLPVRSYLTKVLTHNQLPHALLFAGPSGVGKNLFAKALAATLLKTSQEAIDQGRDPDFHEIRAESKSALHTIETIRKMIEEVYSASFRSFGKVFIIHDADRMQPAAGNALLKTLEEPALDTTFVLLTENEQEILPTIRSRCVTLHFQLLKESEIAQVLKIKGLPEHLAPLAQGSLAGIETLGAQNVLEKKVFSWLSKRLPSHQLIQEIESLEEPEGAIEKHKQAEHVFSLILMWFRDQHAKRLGAQKEDLLFPNEEMVSFPIASMEAVAERVKEARAGFQRNIKLSACLQHVLSI